MIDDELLSRTTNLLDQYLSTLEPGPWTIENACVSAKAVSSYGLPADAQAVRLLIEEPDLGWAVGAEAVYRNGSLWRLRITSFHDDHDVFGGAQGVKRAYLDWLMAL